MDFSKLITRNQLEKAARANGIKGAHKLPYSELEQIVAQVTAANRAAYKALSQREAR